MTTKNENPKPEETSQGTLTAQSNTLQGHLQAPVPPHGISNQGITFNLNINPPVIPSREKDCSTCEKTIIAYVLEILNQFSQLTPEEQSIILKMVKDSSITSPKPVISSLIQQVMLGMVKDSSIT